MFMEEEKVSLPKGAITYGIVLGLILVLDHLVQYIFDIYDPPIWYSLLSWVIIISIFILFKIRFRNEELGGFISYGNALGLGTLIFFYSSIIYSLYYLILTTYIDTNYINILNILLEEKYLLSGMDEDSVDVLMKIMKRFQTPMITFILNILVYSLIGVVLSLFSSILIKKEKPLFDN